MFFFKSCQRCSGDRVLEQDCYGSYLTCVACGHVTYLNSKYRANLDIKERTELDAELMGIRRV
jgi:hypothetical protein